MHAAPGDTADWYVLNDPNSVTSPGLLIYPDRVEENIRRMLAIAGDPARLRPHVKTHKLGPLVRMQAAAGISRFKCSTIAEAEMVAENGAFDILLAYQPVGPNIDRVADLADMYPEAHFSTVVDNVATLEALSHVMDSGCRPLGVLVDLDVGQGRTGVRPGDEALRLYAAINRWPGLRAAGLHVYDGHVRSQNLAERATECEAVMAPVLEMRRAIEASSGKPCPLVAGGTPTFALHAAAGNRECSPGTPVLWDASYGSKFPDLQFLPAAMVLARVVSKPAPDRLTLDLGYKAISADNPDPRVLWPDLLDAKMVLHSEEHMTITTRHAAEYHLGDELYGVPWHICPTVALYQEANVVHKGEVTDQWPITARDREITV